MSGLFETLTSFGLLAHLEPDVPERPFAVEIVAPGKARLRGASGLSLGAHRAYHEIERISAEVGYENAAFFRRVFKRTTRLTPGAYRRL